MKSLSLLLMLAFILPETFSNSDIFINDNLPEETLYSYQPADFQPSFLLTDLSEEELRNDNLEDEAAKAELKGVVGFIRKSLNLSD